MTKTLDFNDLATGTIVDNEFQSQGVTINAWTSQGDDNRAMIFDTANPTGRDDDLATNNLGNVLIISEDGDSSDPDDNARGGTFQFTFDEGANVQSLTFLDNEEGVWVHFYDEYGNLITTVDVPTTGDNGQVTIDFNVDGVFRMDVELRGSGAIDNLVYEDIGPDLDGTVEGTAGDDVIDVNYDGDPDGDRVDNNDAILPGDTGDDDLIFGFDGDDKIVAGNGDDEVFGGEGNDEIFGGAGDDILNGGNGNDLVEAGFGEDEIFGGDGDDDLWASGDNDTVFGGAGNDSSFGGQGSDTLHGDSGDDTLSGGSGDDVVFGGEGNDIIEGDTLYKDDNGPAGDDVLFGGNGNDSISGNGGNDTIYGEAGKDTIDGGDGEDEIFGGSGFDRLAGGAGNDTLYGDDGTDVIHGGDGDDEAFGGNGHSEIFGGNGNDTLYGEGDQDWLHGDDGEDTLFGGGGDDMLFGGNDDDMLFAGDGDDTVQGGEGDDKIEASAGNDTVFGDAGNDDIWAGSGDDVVFGGAGNDSVNGGAGDDSIEGGAGNDLIDSGDGNDVVFGGDGNDGIWAGKGDDIVDGGAGDDVIDGASGDDVLTGGAGADRLFGGNDADTLVADSDDTIVDGGAGGNDDDTLDLTGQGPFFLDNLVPDSNGNGFDGTVVFVNADGEPTGETIDFTEIENFLGDQVEQNEAPDAVDDAVDASEDGLSDLGNVLANDTDTNGDTLTVTDVNGQPAGTPVEGDNGGLVTINPDGSASFDPNGAFEELAEGETATTTVTYTVDDGNGGTDTATVTITVTGANDAPTAVADGATVGEDNAPTDVIANVLDNDNDVDGDPLTVTEVNGEPAGTPVAGDNGGLVTINPDGSVSFDPNGAFEDLSEGETATTEVTYTISDGNGGTDTATVTITVTGTNDAPTAVADTDSTDQDTAIVLDNVLGNDTDPEDDQLTVSAVNGDAANVGEPIAGDNGGLITINADGTASFDPNGAFDDLGAGETTTTEISYTVVDENGLEDTTTVTVTVTGANDGPTAVADTFTAGEDDPAAELGNVLGNDTDPDGDTLTVTEVDGEPAGTPVAGSEGGLVTITPDGTINFDPDGDFEDLGAGETATTTVSYTVTDPTGAESTATVTITVTGVNDGPEATDNAYVVSLSETAGDIDGNVITDDTGAGVDSDPEDDTLTVVAVDGDAANVGNTVVGDNGGTFTINADGTVDFDAGDDFDDLGLGDTRDSSVTYTIADENGALDTATVTFTVTGLNDGTVQGTAGDDIINPDIPFVDADGDIVDAGDGILPGDEGTDNDVIEGFGGNDTIAAGNGDDVVFGGTGNDLVQGNLGDDELFGGAGDDNLQGGFGNDTLSGDEGDDLLLGNAGDDTLFGGSGDDRLFGAEGDDELFGGTGNDVLEGSEGDDTLTGGEGDDDLWGGLDNDTVFGGAGDDTVAGEDGDDVLDGGLGDDLIDGGAGDDTIIDEEGSDEVFGGDGNDVINVGSTQGDEAPDVGYPEQPSATIPGLVFPGYDADEDPNDDKDFVDGGAGDDIINTGDDDDSIIGGSGNDTINSGFDDDTIDGGTGNDVIEGSEGNDFIEGGDGDDLIFGGLSDPLADLVSFPDDEPDAFGFQDLVPENNGDELFGGAGNDTIFGQDDDDSLFGGDGDDILDGGVDDDLLVGGDGEDTLIGGQGDDNLDGGSDDDVIEGGDGNDLITGGQGADELFGGFGSDTFFGGNGGDVVVGGEDPDDSDIDVLDLTGSNVDRIDFVDGDPEAGTVTFLDGSTMTFSEIENVIPCFTPGTLIATPKGERLVEELQVGDRIITRDNGIQEIAWLGHKPMSGKQLVQNPHLQPVLIKRGALGHGLPERDMMVSPNHRVLISSDKTQLYFEENEVLAAAKHMVGAEGIQTANVAQTTYVHFMFERHEVVLSNGAWTESFQPGDYSLKGIGNSQRNEIFDLFPELQSKSGLEGYQSARKALKKHEAKLLLK